MIFFFKISFYEDLFYAFPLPEIGKYLLPQNSIIKFIQMLRWGVKYTLVSYNIKLNYKLINFSSSWPIISCIQVFYKLISIIQQGNQPFKRLYL